MKVIGSTIQQLDKKRADGSPKPKSECRKWRLWATTDQGRKSRRYEGTYTQAQNALRAFVAELEDMVPNAETFAAYAASWRLWRAESGNYSPNTVSEDKRKVTALCRTELSGMRMDEITPESCRDALLWLKRNPVAADEYTNASMQRFHYALSCIMAQAVADGRLARNPMDSVDAPKCDTEERRALSPSELTELLDKVDRVQLDGRVMAVYTMALLGLRRGEACALRDADVSNMCSVRYTIRAADDSEGAPKTKAGVRTVPVPPRLVDKAEEWRELRRAIGIGDAPTLCCTPRGKVLRPQDLSKWWKAKRESFGYPDLCLHDLRHSNLSMMARHMGAFDLQRYAGWSTIAPAMVYVHDDMESLVRGAQNAWASIERTKNAPE